MQKDLAQQLQDVLHTQFGFADFRPGQAEAITTLLTQHRLLCIQPTGYGKSLLYQLPAVWLEGVTIVISPLLALMRDQIAQLKNRFQIAAGSFNTDQSEIENRHTLQALERNEIRILFIAPEQLNHLDRFLFLTRLPVKLLVVDEAHCISTWGHDFRPSYRQIIHLTQALAKNNPHIKLLALTATANKKAEEDILRQFSIDQSTMIVHRESMNRPNIRLTVVHVDSTAMKLATLHELLSSLDGCGLVYCATRENTEMVADFLNTQGIIATAYHAGFRTDHKRQIQQDFIDDKYKVIAATNALGMGIDKPNLRFVIHFDFPGSITAYYQEVGRSGRDGLPANGILLYDTQDTKIQTYFIESAQPRAADFQLVLNTFAATHTPLHLTMLKRLTGLHPTKLTVVTAELVEQGFLGKVTQRGTQVYFQTNKMGHPALDRYETQYQNRRSELQMMRRYAEQSKRCLMATLQQALGDLTITDCGHCSRCAMPVFHAATNDDFILALSSWLNIRTLPIQLSKNVKQACVGAAVLDGKQKSDLFVQFMRDRTTQTDCADPLLKLIKECLLDLAKRHPISCIIPIPSRTWSAQSFLVTQLAKYLRVPIFMNSLQWQQIPPSRQGELLNNDQRTHNVQHNMRFHSKKKIPKGAILLLDDYIGSGATMNEASRVISEHIDQQTKIVPFAIAAVKWRLGKQGMI